MGYQGLFCLSSSIRNVDWKGVKMKFIVLTFFITLQAVISSAALAWSPLDSFESAVEPMQQCYSIIADSDDDPDGNKKDEDEEEPDCD